MDIGIVHPELIYLRGAEKQVCKLSYYLNKMGHEVTIYTFQKSKNYAFDSLIKDINIISLDKKWVNGPFYSYNLPRWLYLIKKISKQLKNHDIINAHNHPAQWISKFTKIPTVWSCNEPYRHNLPKIIEKLYYFHNRIDNDLSSNTVLTLSNSNSMKKYIKKRYPNAEIENVYVGAEIERKINHLDNNYFDVIFVGPITNQKRPMDILNAFVLIKDNIPNVRIHLVGTIVNFISEKLKKEMIKIANQNEIELIFYNTVSNKKLYDLFDIADTSIFVPESEPFGIFPLETILGGIPTIISDQCGAKEILTSDCPIIETGNIRQLSDKILEINDNYGKYRKIALKNSKIISEKYSWKVYSEKMEKILLKYSH